MSDLPHHSRFFLRFGLGLAKFAGWLLLTVFGPFHTTGKYRVPKSGGLLILSNHLADLDPVAVQVSCPRPIYFMAKSELFEMGLLGKILGWFKAFPVKRGEPDRNALKKAIEYLKEGKAVCVFPEGELSESGDLLPLKPGVALLVRQSGCQVICLGLRNTNKIMPYGKLIPRPAFSKVSADWGEPHSFDKKSEVDEIMGWAEGQLRSLTGQEL
ncbi:MAG: 1-acyl-sn-glycerol-3-phosphate acyltransferase [Fimbriimonadaceae bacterium]|nr:1-acyl-sn-glycerol-3-phosphate acyltransferase [Fimbriimonadaceae bacterium]